MKSNRQDQPTLTKFFDHYDSIDLLDPHECIEFVEDNLSQINLLKDVYYHSCYFSYLHALHTLKRDAKYTRIIHARIREVLNSEPFNKSLYERYIEHLALHYEERTDSAKSIRLRREILRINPNNKVVRKNLKNVILNEQYLKFKYHYVTIIIVLLVLIITGFVNNVYLLKSAYYEALNRFGTAGFILSLTYFVLLQRKVFSIANRESYRFDKN